MKVLALDLGVKTGWCVGSSTRDFELGTKVWSKPKEVTAWRKTRQDRRCDLRMTRFGYWLAEYNGYVDKVIFEDVQFIRSTYQGQLWPSWRTVIWMSFPEHTIECIPVGALKKFATGDGGAGKGGMAEAMRRTDPKRFTIDKSLDKGHVIKDGNRPLTDDAVDAFWLFQWAQKHIKL